MQTGWQQTEVIKDRIMAELDALPDKYLTNFSEFEDEMIRKFYPSKGSTIAGKLGKTQDQVRHRAEHLGIRKIRFKEAAQ